MVNRNRIKEYLEELGITELNKIKSIREGLGLSVSDLAEVCNISVGEMSMIENHLRIPNQVTLIRILRGFKRFDIHPHDIFTFY